jgi:hypothetical protein
MFKISREKGNKPNCSGLRDPSEMNGDTLSNMGRDARRHFRIKKKGSIWKTKLMRLQRTEKQESIDLYRGINKFKRSYQPRSNLLKEENGDLLADSHNILNWLKNYFLSY